MTLPWSRCSRFKTLLDESDERELSDVERRFFERHRSKCKDCDRSAKGARGLNMLRSASFEATVDSSFDQRLIRRWRIDQAKAGFSYWSPALIGAAIAGLAVLSAVQMVTKSSDAPVFNGVGEARRTAQPLFPDLKRLNQERLRQ